MNEESGSSRRIEGWLWVLAVGMVLLVPVVGAGGMYGDIKDVEKEFHGIADVREWQNFKLLTGLTFAAFTGIGVYGAWGLAMGTDWAVIRRTKVILWMIGPVVMLFTGLLIPAVSFGQAEWLSSDFQLEPSVFQWVFVGFSFFGCLVGSCWALVWTAYLNRSQRVRDKFKASN